MYKNVCTYYIEVHKIECQFIQNDDLISIITHSSMKPNSYQQINVSMGKKLITWCYFFEESIHAQVLSF